MNLSSGHKLEGGFVLLSPYVALNYVNFHQNNLQVLLCLLLIIRNVIPTHISIMLAILMIKNVSKQNFYFLLFLYVAFKYYYLFYYITHTSHTIQHYSNKYLQFDINYLKHKIKYSFFETSQT